MHSKPTFTTLEKAGLILTGVVTTVGIIAAEVTLVIIEVAVLELGPVGMMYLIDVDVALIEV